MALYHKESYMTMLTTGNSKLKRTCKKRGILVGVFTLPAQLTCPRRDVCTNWCYASVGPYLFPAPANHAHSNYRISRSNEFIDLMVAEIQDLIEKGRKQNKKVYIRLHDSGDFYDDRYINMWKELISCFGGVQFYCYTKSHVRLLELEMNKLDNFTIIPSKGGKDDDKITTAHAFVVPVGTTTLPPNCEFGDMDDDLHSVDCIKAGKSVALVAHGARKFKVGKV